MPTQTDPLVCKCGKLFGYAYIVDGVFVGAQIGSLVVDESLHGKCAHCGRGIHLVVNRKAYLKLMNRYQETKPLMIEISEVENG